MHAMTNFGYNNRWVRLIKDILFVALAIWLISSGKVFVVIIGVLALYWYGRDAYFQGKALWQEKHYTPRQDGPRPGPSSAREDDGKITVTNLSDAKEVDFEKE